MKTKVEKHEQYKTDSTSREPVERSELMTEEELIDYLRIPEVSGATHYHNVIENLKRMHDLPRIHICGKPLYPLKAIRQWIERHTRNGN